MPKAKLGSIRVLVLLAVAAGVDAAGNVYTTEEDNHHVRRVDSSGQMTTVAGTGVSGHAWDGGPPSRPNIRRRDESQ